LVIRRPILALACIVFAVGAGSVGFLVPRSAASTAFTIDTASPCSASWTSYLHDLSNTGDNACDPVDRGSVGALRLAWQKSGLVGVTGVPVVSNGIVYFGDDTGTEWAVRARDGSVVWNTKVATGVIGSAAVSGDALYVGAGADLYRLDRRTGTVVWTAVTNTNPFSQINASPVVIGNEVVIGTASFEVVVKSSSYSFQGSIGAFDTRTGKQLWNFVTTPNNTTSGAGEGIWSTAAVDPELGLLYVGSGQNLAPPPGPLEDSILAIDYSTGKLVWSMQATNDDVFSAGYPNGFDYDFGASPNLFRVQGRELVGDGDKAGVYYALDAKTGQIAWKTRLAPGGPFGGVLGSAGFVGGRLIASANIGSRTVKETTNACKVVALDPDTGGVQWVDRFSGNIYGPITGTSDVAFVGTTAGSYYALDVRTGRILWQSSAPAQVGGGGSIVGTRVFWGYGFTLFSGPGQGGLISFSLPTSPG
jgi:polyvinyl alcohol dehydrogenase (cytochrome)